MFNDFYAKDTSKKVRAILRARGTSGKHLGKPPYGYREDPANRGHWLVDEEAAKVVKRIFDLTIDGKGPSKIARILREEQVLMVRSHYARQKGKPLPSNPCNWDDSSVVGILERMEYMGCTCNFKTYSKSYKLKKRIANSIDDMVIIPDTQEAIVSKEQWERAQELRKSRRRMTKAERQGLFSGLLCCADCGSVLHFATCKSFNGRQDHYVCAKYKSGAGECSAHYIREEVLNKLVLERIRAVNAFIRKDAEGFREEWLQCRRDEQERSIREDTRRMAAIQKRLDDIDRLITRIYEDTVLGNLSQERYRKMQQEYEAEQERLKLELSVLEEWIEQQHERADNYDQFHALVEKYVDMPELTPTIVNEYIKKIIVYAPDKSSGHRTQKIQIIFNFLEDASLPWMSEAISYGAKDCNGKTA